MQKIIHSIAIDITNNCNFNCRHCFNCSGEERIGLNEMDDEVILNIIKDVAQFSPSSLCICGGEALLKTNFLYRIGKTVRQIYPDYVSLNMVTNGYLMTIEIAEKLKECGFSMVQVSLDGAKDETHNWLRKNDKAYEKAINALKILHSVGIKTSVACAPSKRNFDEIENLIHICKSLNVSIIRFQPMMIMGRAINLKNEVLNEIEYAKLAKIVHKYQNDKQISVEWGDPLQHLEYIKQDSSKMYDLSISAYGDIMISPYLPISAGNLKKYKFSDYMNAGLEDAYNLPIVNKMISFMIDWDSMQLNNINPIFPRIGLDRYINCDIIDIANNDTKIIKTILNL